MQDAQLDLPLNLPPGAMLWDETLQARVTELNGQLLERLCALAVQETAQDALLLRALQPLWRQLTHAGRQALACSPVLLLDAGLADPTRWRLMADPAVMEVEAVCPNPYFRDAADVALLRRVLVFAWHLARSNPLAGRVMLGMTAPVAMRLAGCRLDALEQLAECRPAWIRPRWESQPLVWRQWLQAAGDAGAPALPALRWRAVQLLAANLWEG